MIPYHAGGLQSEWPSAFTNLFSRLRDMRGSYGCASILGGWLTAQVDGGVPNHTATTLSRILRCHPQPCHSMHHPNAEREDFKTDIPAEHWKALQITAHLRGGNDRNQTRG